MRIFCCEGINWTVQVRFIFSFTANELWIAKSHWLHALFRHFRFFFFPPFFLPFFFPFFFSFFGFVARLNAYSLITGTSSISCSSGKVPVDAWFKIVHSSVLYLTRSIGLKPELFTAVRSAPKRSNNLTISTWPPATEVSFQSGLINPFKPEFTIVIFIHYKPQIAVAILDL